MRWCTYVSRPSQGTTLRSGDIVGSDTVETGCILELSAVREHDAYPWLKPGDRVRLEMERLGVINSTIWPSVAVIPLRR